ncbi:SLBB domain-containing protein [Acidobacteriota bacterium]
MRKLQNKANKLRYSITSCILFTLIILLVSSVSSGFHIPLQQDSILPDQDYKIGARDMLEIRVFELPELNQTVRVYEDGSISLSLLGKVEVAGLTAQELEEKLAMLLDQEYTRDAHVTVFIKEFQKVSVLGAVGNPGMYELVGSTSLLQIIALAGGLTPEAMEELFIYRQKNSSDQTKITVNLKDLMVNGNQDLNIMLHPKDVVSIPMAQTLNVFVYGEVKNPGVIQFLSSKKITLLQAIAQAGGTTDWAKKKGVIIRRKEQNSGIERKIKVNLKAVINGNSPDLILIEGDIVIVP